MAAVNFVKVAKIDDLPPGGTKQVRVRKDDVLLVNVEGTIHACDAICTHQLYPLRNGDLDGEEIVCALHGAIFNVTTGEAVTEPATRPLRTFEVKVEDSFIMVGAVKG